MWVRYLLEAMDQDHQVDRLGLHWQHLWVTNNLLLPLVEAKLCAEKTQPRAARHPVGYKGIDLGRANLQGVVAKLIGKSLPKPATFDGQ
jgi:hypothetical protein